MPVVVTEAEREEGIQNDTLIRQAFSFDSDLMRDQ
jgi:hypothetical protein